VATTLEKAIQQLEKDPTKPVRARVGRLTVEVRAVTEADSGRSAADVFASVGPWGGESTDELLALLAEARQKGGRRSVPTL